MNKNYDITNEMKIFIVLLFLLIPNPVLAYNKVIELNDLTKVSRSEERRVGKECRL